MQGFKKLAEKESIRNKKNPGKANREKRNEINKSKRGNPIPISKVVIPKKVKENSRSKLKDKLKREIENE